MKFILILLSCLLFVSCSMNNNNVTSKDFWIINSDLKLDEAKDSFRKLYDDDYLITKTIDRDDYTVLILKKLISVDVQAYSTYDNYHKKSVSRSKSVNKYAKFYLVFKNENYFFSGMGYEIEISPYREILNSIIDRSTEKTE